MVKDKYLIKFKILFIFLTFILCFCFTIREFQNDTFYMIKLGDYIFHNGIDLKDHWVWMFDLPYTYPHWLYDLYIYIIYRYFGFLGIYISSIFSFIILIFIIYFINNRINKNEFMSFFVALLSIFISSGIITARAQVFSYIIFLFKIYFILRIIDCGKKRYILYLFILSLLLANIHATVWLFFFILFFPFFGEEFFNKIKCKFKLKINDKLSINIINNFKYLLYSFFICFFAGVFSPSRICYSYVFKIMHGDSQEFILEHLPLVIIDYPFFLGAIFVLLLVLIFTKTKIKLHELFMIGGLFLMSCMSSRHVFFFYFIGFLFISIIVMRYFVEKNDITFNYLYNFVTHNNFIYFGILLLVIIGVFINYNKNTDISFINKKKYPVDSVIYIKNNLDYKNIKIYNGYNYGSYMMFNDIPIFIDSRCDLYLPEFNKMNINIFDDDINMKYKDYKKLFDKYNVEYALVMNDSILYEFLIRDIGNTIYHDKYFTLFKYK